MKLYHLDDYISPGFPLAVWPVRKAGENVVHRHDCIELALITRGSGVCRINETPYPILRGDLYVLNPHDTHSYAMEPSCSFYNILFRRELVGGEPFLAELLDGWERPSRRKLYQFENGEIEAEDRRFEEIAEELKAGRPGYQLAARSLFIGFLVKLVRMDDKTPRTTPRHQEDVSRVLEYIHANLGQALSLKELAKVVNMSVPAFGGAFRQWTGCSAFDYIGNLRIRKARQLLEERALSVGEIALRLGFYDSCHFSRTFRRKTGVSPREYRKL